MYKLSERYIHVTISIVLKKRKERWNYSRNKKFRLPKNYSWNSHKSIIRPLQRIIVESLGKDRNRHNHCTLNIVITPLKSFARINLIIHTPFPLITHRSARIRPNSPQLLRSFYIPRADIRKRGPNHFHFLDRAFRGRTRINWRPDSLSPGG